jgi:hypothetical protein
MVTSVLVVFVLMSLPAASNADGSYQREIHINVPYDHKVRPWMGNMPFDMPASEEQPSPLLNQIVHCAISFYCSFCAGVSAGSTHDSARNM